MSSGLLSMVVKTKSCAVVMSRLLVITLFEPGIAVIVVAPHLPEAGLVDRRKLDALDPFGALPETELRNDYAQRAAMFPADRLAVPAPGQHRVRGREVGERHVGRVGVVGMENHVLCLRLWPDDR